MVRRHELTDQEWELLAPLMPRAATERYGPWKTVYTRFRRYALEGQTVYGLFRHWQRDGTWRELLTGLQVRAAAGLITWEVNVDSTICRAHQHAAGARRDGQAQNEPPGGTAPNPRTMAWAGPGEASPRRSTWPASKGKGRCPCWSPLVSVVTVLSSPPSWMPSGCPAPDRAVPVSVRCGCGATWRIRPAPTGPAFDSAESAARSRSLPTRPPTANAAGRPAGGLLPSTTRTTKPGTRSNAGSTGSSATGRRHPVRQTRGPLRSHRPDRRDRRVAIAVPPAGGAASHHSSATLSASASPWARPACAAALRRWGS
ncbi:hypothetical protein SUDANB9_00150 [Streptomyces sp. enrichment culture]